MPSNPHRPGSSAAQSFRADEIEALDALLSATRRGAHPRDLTRLVGSDAMTRIARKVEAMKRSIARQRELCMRAIDGGKAK